MPPPSSPRERLKGVFIAITVFAVAIIAASLWFFRPPDVDKKRDKMANQVEQIALQMEKQIQKISTTENLNDLERIYQNEIDAQLNRFYELINKADSLAMDTTAWKERINDIERRLQQKLGARQKELAAALAESLQKITNSIGMKFVYIPPGTFTMGSPDDAPLRYYNETQHQVTLTNGFYMQITEVTQG